MSGGVAILVMVGIIMPPASVRPQSLAGMGALLSVLKRNAVRIGVAGLFLAIVGQFSAYTYIAPFLEERAGISAAGLSGILLASGAAGFFGNIAGGCTAARAVRGTLIFAVLLMSASIGLLIVAGSTPVLSVLIIITWGFGYGIVPVAMLNWMFAAVPDHLKAASAWRITTIYH